MGAFGQYLYKLGAADTGPNPILWLINWKIILAIMLYIGVMACFVAAFKIGGQLTVLYPIYATTFVFGALIGVFLLHEPLTPWKIAGTILIIAGAAIIAR